MSSSRSAFVVGATGAVGRRLVEVLVESKDFTRVVLLGRRTIDDFPKSDKIEQKIVDFEKIEDFGEQFKGLDVGFCTLGTTRGKSGAKMFYHVDHDYVVNTAKVAKEQGVKEFVLVTAVNSNENSMFLYPKTKGEAERDVAALGFQKTLIVRPAFLEGPREESRLMEGVARFFITPLKFFTNKLAISTTDVAKAMVIGALSSDLEGKVIWENAELIEKAKLFTLEDESTQRE